MKLFSEKYRLGGRIYCEAKMERGYGSGYERGRAGSGTYRGPEKFWRRMLRRNRAFMLWFPAMLIYDELVFHIATGSGKGLAGVFYTLVFSLAAGCFLTLISTIFINKINVYIVTTLNVILTFLYGAHLVYLAQFQTFFRWSTIGQAGEVTQFWREALMRILLNIVPILFLLVPLVFYCVWGRELAPALGTPLRVKGILLALTVMFHLTALAGIITDADAGEAYRGYFNPADVSSYFGLLTETRLDIKYTLFGEPDGDDPGGHVGEIVDPFGKETTGEPQGTDEPTPPDGTGTGGPDETDTPETEVPAPPKEYGDNVLDIDWESLISSAKDKKVKEAHEYFSTVTPTKQNEYTGYFEGKNLIQLTLEGFSSIIVEKHPELFPTMYKMMHEGFYLENYYNSLWGGSTATGEYLSMTGLFHNSAQCLKMSGGKYWPFTLGNVFTALDYTVYAYHNNSYTYYSRNLSHPSFGYKNWLAVGNGLDDLSKAWPRSDLEMAEKTIDDYINNAPFHAYYMTVSGHANYTFAGNAMATRHRSEVAELPYSDNVKSYYACQLEVEYMLKYLVEKLEEAGQLENTVFVFNADHYPYALSDSEAAELYGLPEDGVRDKFELYRNGAAIWCASMKEPVVISKPCSALDLIPTVLNLFGVKYDSRLLMGVDLNSTTDPIVILNTTNTSWNWMNPNGTYSSKTKKFTPAEGVTVDESQLDQYIKQMNSVVSQKRKYSLRILETDYYKYVFPSGISSYK